LIEYADYDESTEAGEFDAKQLRTYKNVLESPWGQAQMLRQEVYTRWAKIPKERGIVMPLGD
jgi:hypothetical protein